MPEVLIRNADYVVTVDKARRMIRDGAIAISGNTIVAVGKTSEVAPRYPHAEVIDARGKLAMPGIFDTHIHNAQQLGRGLADEAISGPERLFKRLWVVESHMDAGDALCAARLCQLELIRAGTTCFADPGNYFGAETAQAVGESGMRGMIARTVFDMGQTNMGSLPKNFFEPTDTALARASVARAHGHAPRSQQHTRVSPRSRIPRSSSSRRCPLQPPRPQPSRVLARR